MRDEWSVIHETTLMETTPLLASVAACTCWLIAPHRTKQFPPRDHRGVYAQRRIQIDPAEIRLDRDEKIGQRNVVGTSVQHDAQQESIEGNHRHSSQIQLQSIQIRL